MAWDDGIEGVHLDIARDPLSPLQVFAGPGTGKTFAMMRRIARLLEEGADPTKILAVTFTRTAATDLREQLESLGIPRTDQVIATTLHSLCFSFLAEESVFDLTHRFPRPLLAYERTALVNDLADRFDGKRNVKRLLTAYEAAWARLQTDIPGGPSAQIDIAFHTAVLDWLSYHRSMLIGELIPLSLAFIRQNPAISAVPSFDHVLVDEYQDLNSADQALIEELTGTGSLLVVGDDSQSIYGFRHANPEGIRTFGEEHTDTILYTIEECRRCPGNIVSMSNALISNDPHRARETPLRSTEGREDAQVFIVQHLTLDDEVEACADFVRNHLDTHDNLPAGQVLILTPRRLVGNKIRDALIHRGLNSLSYFSEDPLQETAAAEGFCLLGLLADKTDRTALRAWLGMGSSNGLAGSYRYLRAHAEANLLSPDAVLQEVASGSLGISRIGRLAERWSLLQERLESLEGLNGLGLVRNIWPENDESVDDIRIIAENIALRVPEPVKLLRELIKEVTQPHLPDSQSDIVRVMSLHKSKGLTASVVVVAGCMSGAIPHIDRNLSPEEQDAQRAEQRRLFYVAITRASSALVISSAARLALAEARRANVQVVGVSGYGAEAIAETSASPFIAELGPDTPHTMTTEEWRAAARF